MSEVVGFEEFADELFDFIRKYVVKPDVPSERIRRLPEWIVPIDALRTCRPERIVEATWYFDAFADFEAEAGLEGRKLREKFKETLNKRCKCEVKV